MVMTSLCAFVESVVYGYKRLIPDSRGADASGGLCDTSLVDVKLILIVPSLPQAVQKDEADANNEWVVGKALTSAGSCTHAIHIRRCKIIDAYTWVWVGLR